jgi:hypothetical protein
MEPRQLKGVQLEAQRTRGPRVKTSSSIGESPWAWRTKIDLCRTPVTMEELSYYPFLHFSQTPF